MLLCTYWRIFSEKGACRYWGETNVLGPGGGMNSGSQFSQLDLKEQIVDYGKFFSEV